MAYRISPDLAVQLRDPRGYVGGTDGADVIDTWADRVTQRIFAAGGDDLLRVEYRDVVLLSGKQSDYQVIRSGPDSHYTLLDRISLRDGVDTVTGAGWFQFADRLIGSAAVLLGATVNTPHSVDFSGDGRADLIWLGLDGRTALWEMNGAAVARAQPLADPGSCWTLAATGDANGDGQADLLWRGNDGGIALWSMRGAEVLGAAMLPNPGLDWTLAGMADVTGDRQADLVWYDATRGDLVVWRMEGGAVAAAEPVLIGTGGPLALGASSFAGLADMTGDGRADIIVRDSFSGALIAWPLEGARMAPSGAVRTADVSEFWNPAGFDDVNGDGRADVIWRGADGSVAIWQMAGMTPQAAATIGNPGLWWTLAGHGDYDGDGKADLLWRGLDGRVAVWQMDGLGVKAVVEVGALDPWWGTL